MPLWPSLLRPAFAADPNIQHKAPTNAEPIALTAAIASHALSPASSLNKSAVLWPLSPLGVVALYEGLICHILPADAWLLTGTSVLEGMLTDFKDMGSNTSLGGDAPDGKCWRGGT
jgi:hypothetical protein